MDIKTIKKANTLTSLVVTLLMVIGLFSGMFIWWNWNAQDSGVTLDAKYNSSYGNITAARNDLSDNVNAIKNNVDNIKEAETTWQVAWNGLKGIGNTLKLPISFVSTSLATYTGLEFALDYIPAWARTLFFIGITALVVFLVLSVLKGDPRL